MIPCYTMVLLLIWSSAALASNAANSSTKPLVLASKPKTVFAHYMMCFHAFSNCTYGPDTCPYATFGPSKWIEGYEREIAYAQRYGLDGFALEWLRSKSPSAYNESFTNIFLACERYNARRGATWETAKSGGPVPFSLIPMIDGGNYSMVRDRILTQRNSSCLYRVDGRVFISSWGGGLSWRNKSSEQEAANKSAEWEREVVAPFEKLGEPRPLWVPFMYPPNYDDPPSHADTEYLITNVTAIDGLWYWGCTDYGNVVANVSVDTVQTCQEHGKLSAAPISAPYSPHGFGNNRYFPMAGAKGMIQTWNAHIESQPDLVIYSTWNDLREHHYLGPYNHTIWGIPHEDTPVWHTKFPHLAYLQLSSYFIRWYKLPPGSMAPPVRPEDEAVFYFYNLQPVHNHCPGDPVPPPSIGGGGYCPSPRHCSDPWPSYRHCVSDNTSRGRPGVHNCNAEYKVEDAVYVTTLLAAPGTLIIESGLPFTKPPGMGATGFSIPGSLTPSNTSFQMPAGLHSVQVPALPGGQRFTFVRGGTTVREFGSEGINTTEMSVALCDRQTFTGVLKVP